MATYKTLDWTIGSGSYKNVKWIGRTKGGDEVIIEIPNALNMGNIDWTFADKDDVVSEVVFTAAYEANDIGRQTKGFEATPLFKIMIDGNPSGNDAIMLGAGVLKINDVDAGITRGGGQFTVEREFREIEADGDMGPVKDRIVIDRQVATLRMNMLQVIANLDKIYPGMATFIEGTTV